MYHMSVLNLRGVDDGLMAKVKAEAALRGVTLRAFVVEVLTAACGGTGPARVKVGKVVESPAAVSRIVAEVSEAVTMKPRSAGLTTLTAAAITGRPTHDPKTCRVYRCGACANAGHKDPHRGL